MEAFSNVLNCAAHAYPPGTNAVLIVRSVCVPLSRLSLTVSRCVSAVKCSTSRPAAATSGRRWSWTRCGRTATPWGWPWRWRPRACVFMHFIPCSIDVLGRYFLCIYSFQFLIHLGRLNARGNIFLEDVLKDYRFSLSRCCFLDLIFYYCHFTFSLWHMCRRIWMGERGLCKCGCDVVYCFSNISAVTPSGNRWEFILPL